MEPRADLQQRSNPPAHLDLPRTLSGNPRKNLEQSGLARPIPPDNPQQLMPAPPGVRHLGCAKAFLRNLFFGPSQGPQFPPLHLKRNILQRIDPIRMRSLRSNEGRGTRDEGRGSRVESRGQKKIFYHGYQELTRIQNPNQFAPRKRGSHSRSEWKRVFRSPSASLLASGLPKTPPNQHADSRQRFPFRENSCASWLIQSSAIRASSQEATRQRYRRPHTKATSSASDRISSKRLRLGPRLRRPKAESSVQSRASRAIGKT
jgi:hypothetical protein